MLTRPRVLMIGLFVAVVAIAAAGLMFSGAPERANASVTPLALQLSWKHNGAFGGYYAADRLGFYAEEGLAVSFLEGGPAIDPVERVIEGQARFGVANANLLIKARAEGRPVRAIAAIQRRNPLVFITLRESGISHPRQFAGKTIMASRQDMPILRALMRRFDIAPSRYKVVQTSELSRFYNGEVDVWLGFLFAATGRIARAGYEYDLIHPDDYGVHGYQNCLFTTDELIADNPDLVTRFLRATLTRGWRYSAANPDAAGRLTAHYDPGADAAREGEFLVALMPLINTTGEASLGWMEAAVWAEMTTNLDQLGLLDRRVEPEDVYTMRFLEEIYGSRR